MHTRKQKCWWKSVKLRKKCLSLFLALALMLSAAPVLPGGNWQVKAADQLSGSTEKPVLVISGQGIITGGNYSAGNISNEKSYTLTELQELEEITQLYSAINTNPTKSIYLGKGIPVDTLLEESNVSTSDYDDYKIDIVAKDGYTVRFDPDYTGDSSTKGKPLKTPGFNVERYYFPNLKELTVDVDNEGNYIYSNEEAASVGAEAVPTILAWERGGDRGEPETEPTETEDLYSDEKPLLLMVGQQEVWEQNNPLFNKSVNKIIVGDALTEALINIDGKNYTRSEILLMERAERSYTYSTQGGDNTDYVRGVPLAVLFKDYSENDVVSFTAADGWEVQASGMTLGELVSGNYMLAYEKGNSSADLDGIYSTAKNDPSIKGYFTLYGDGASPAKMIDSITITPASGNDYVNSPFKHITNGGISGQEGPYNLDAITGATLTIEGPGVVSSVPLPIRELEMQNAGAHRDTYTDYRDGSEWTLQYEGIRLSHILNAMTSGENGIHLTKDAHKVLIKNRVRQTIAEFTLDDIEEADEAGKPIIIAYGTGSVDGTIAAPFVYDGGSGYRDSLDNDDGPIKLVYDKSALSFDPNPNYIEFGNVAYIYVCEETSPGYKHNVEPYNAPENSQYVLTVTGDAIGREVNYTVEQLENMVEYDSNGAPIPGGMGYRDEYSLSNSTYWYVNEYEGVQLWKLLLKSGLPATAASGPQKDTLVSFSATDNYKDFDKFTIEQVSNPDFFKYYEKNPADLNDGNYTGDDSVDLRGTGYPVLVAYGVNSYPYVIKNTLDGYMSGLSNDGGPLRIISGKTAYNHANGSRQAKLLDKIIVGTDNYYSTHKYNPNFEGAYQEIAENSTLNVKVVSGSAEDGNVLKEITYKVGELEELLYGGSLTSAQLKEAKVKGFYEIYKNGTFYNDLYEGLNLQYFLENVVQLPGYKGTITFSDGTNNLSMGLEEVLGFSGYNGTTKLSGLTPIIAYAKNGTPMVSSKDAAGYEGDVTLAAGTEYQHTITVKNNGGPLAIIFPRVTADAADAAALTSVISITINLTPDNYAHTELPYSSLASNTITISGEGTRLNNPKTFTVADIEGKQTLAVTGDYNIRKAEDSESQLRYRGIPLYDFLSSTDVGLKPNADKVIVTCSDNTSYTFELAEVYKSDYINGQNQTIDNLKMILAYGSAAVDNPDLEDGKPLVKDKTSEGYVEAYSNSGGPIRLVVGQIDGNDINSGKCLKDVTAIEVTASEMVSWNHSASPIYQQYLNATFKLQVVDNSNNILLDKDYTLAELEAMTSLIERENITWVGTQEWEGINLWDFVLQEANTITGITDPISITAYASDGFTKELRSIFGMDALENGIKDGQIRIPIIIAYAVNGYPLVPSNTSDGYTALAGNGDGPLRLMTHLNQGACLKQTIKLVVKVGDGGSDPPPVTEKDFNIYGLESGTIAMDIKAIKNITTGYGKTIADYTWKGNTDMVKGAYLVDLLEAAGVTGSEVKINIVTSDGFAPDHYKDLTLDTIESQEYLVAYDITTDGGNTWTGFSDEDNSGVKSTVRIYRRYDDGSSTWYNRITNVKGVTVTGAESDDPIAFNVYPADGSPGNLPLAGVRSISFDGAGGLWVSTYGGGIAYKAAAADTFTIYNKDSNPPLATATVSMVAVDASGGIWITQDGSYTDLDKSQGVAYMKDGQITYYKQTDDPKTIPHDYVLEIKIDESGKVWFGSMGGLTIYDPAQQTWTTWDQSYEDADGDHFPAMGLDSLTLDGKGGAWLGFIPNGQGTALDPHVGGFAHFSADGNIDAYQYTADYDEESQMTLGAQVWVRDIALDNNGGAWTIASGSYPGQANVGGSVRYVNAQGVVTEFTGHEILGAGVLSANSEIRMVAVDPDGGLWFGTSGDGVFYIAEPGPNAPFTITAHYSGKNGSWPKSAAWDNIFRLEFIGNTLYVCSNAGLAYHTFDFTGSEEPVIIESFTISGVGSEDIAYYVGGAYEHTLKGLAGDAGKVNKSYLYNGTTHYVKGAFLSTVLADAGAGENIKITIKTSDGYTKSSYENIPYADIVAQEYFLAYDVGEGTETLSKIADTDNNGVTASYRIYRNYDGGADGQKDNRIKGVTGIIVSPAGSGGDSDPDPGNYDLTINGPGVVATARYTISELKNADGIEIVTNDYNWLNNYGTTGSDEFEGVYLENLLNDVVGLKPNAKSITVTAFDQYHRSFNLDNDELGVYWKDIQGNQIMLAWERNGSPCDLQLVVGQIDEEHINKPLWVSDVKVITVNTETTDPGSGTPGGYEGQPKPGQGSTIDPASGTINTEIEAELLIAGNTANGSVSLADINRMLENIEEQQSNDGIVSDIILELNAVSKSSPGQITAVNFKLPAGVLKALVREENITVIIKTDLGEIMLNPEVLKQLAANCEESVIISLSLSTDSNLNSEAREVVGDRPVFDLRIIKDGKEINNLNENQIRIALSYTAENENSNQLLAYYINDEGEALPVISSLYDQEAGRLLFATNHFSLYAVGYNPVTFDDIQQHWAKENIQFLAARKLINGKGAGIFDPDNNVTRAEFVTMLANLAGDNVNAVNNAAFADVNSGDWYFNYVNWAVAKGIVSGYGNGRFGPYDMITREQMAVMTDNFIKAVKAGLIVVNEKASFTDQANISSWAAESVARMQQYGIINGRPDNSFAPQGTATRAEAATVIKGYINALMK